MQICYKKHYSTKSFKSETKFIVIESEKPWESMYGLG
jgi:hypothetical protein